eukprot:7172047-Prorocentrum_lima.AAC.1
MAPVAVAKPEASMTSSIESALAAPVESPTAAGERRHLQHLLLPPAVLTVEHAAILRGVRPQDRRREKFICSEMMRELLLRHEARLVVIQ